MILARIFTNIYKEGGIILIDAVGFLVTDSVIYWISILFIFTNTLSLIVYFIDPGIKILRNIK